MSIFKHKDKDDDTYYGAYVSGQYGPEYTTTETALIRIANALEKIASAIQRTDDDNK